jgi:hypothetical protein
VKTPDVTVVVAVYNTMPYLTKCMDSLMRQSIGLGRMEVVAVDDGSTDESGPELDRYAETYPDTVKVIHQSNSGGPAAPSNRALDVATGRYVFFLGADDYLGDEALERLVNAADNWGSDIVLGKMVGVNGRYAHQAIFDTDREDIDLFDSPLPYHLSNTKLFRRQLLETHKIRYPEHLLVGSDQPFTLEACVRAGRISVLADYPFYYAVKRRKARNMTYQSRPEQKLEYTTDVLEFVARLVEPGPQRDAVTLRHFDWELAKLVQDDYLQLDAASQERVRSGIATLMETYFTDNIRDQLGPEARIRLEVARCGTAADLVAVIQQDAHVGVPASVHEGDRWFASYPGFRDSRSLPDHAFDVTTSLGVWLGKLDATAFRLRRAGRLLEITLRSPVTDLGSRATGPIDVRAGLVPARTMTMRQDDRGAVLSARFAVGELAHRPAKRGRHVWTLGASLGSKDDIPVRISATLQQQRMLGRDWFQLFRITVAPDNKGQLIVTTVPFTVHQIVGRLRRVWRKGRRK